MIYSSSTRAASRKPRYLLPLLLCAVVGVSACSSSSDDDDGGALSDPVSTDGTTNDDTTIDGTTTDGTTTDDTTIDGATVDDTTTDASTLLAVTATRANDFTAGRTDIISLDTDTVSGSFAATGSDIQVNTDGESVYQIGRFSLDNITKYSVDDTASPIYQYSVVDQDAVEGEGANPYTIAFVNETKAYVIRYGSPRIWIINPSAQSEEEFKTGELNIGVYDSDITPEANSAVLVDGKLFVMMERLDQPAGFVVDKVGYVAVFDTATDEEIDTGMGTADGLNGIPLGVENPIALQYSASDDMIYLIGRGKSFSPAEEGLERFTGGIEVIDPDTFLRETILDDGTEESNDGFFNDLLVVDGTNAFLTTSAAFADNTLRGFTPVTGLLDEAPVDSLSGLDITTTALDPLNRLWVGLGGDTPGFRLLDATDGSDLQIEINTELVPINVVFLESSTDSQ